MQGTYEEMEGEVIPGHVGLWVVIFQLNLEKYRDVKGQDVRESAFQRHGQKRGGGTTQSSLWRVSPLFSSGSCDRVPCTDCQPRTLALQY